MMTTGRSVGGCCDGCEKPSLLGLLSNTEHREAEPGQNYTERALSAQLGDAAGSRRITPDAIAAVETCLGLYESCIRFRRCRADGSEDRKLSRPPYSA